MFLQSCVSSIVSETDKFLMPVPSSPSNIWYPKDGMTSEPSLKGLIIALVGDQYLAKVLVIVSCSVWSSMCFRRSWEAGRTW
jgi:hypothetical protein